jgi:hypothetical protein
LQGWTDLYLCQFNQLISKIYYSPELNPTEHVWDELREKLIINYTFDSLDVVEDRLVEGLQSLENNIPYLQSMTVFDWIVSIK